MAIFPSLPPELQDMILSATLRLYSTSDLPPNLQQSLGLPNVHYRIRAYRKRHDGRELALVCKRWAEFVHARVFRNVYLRRPDKLGGEIAFMKDSSGIKHHCKEVDMGMGHVSQREYWGYVRNLWSYLCSLERTGVKLEIRGALKRAYRRTQHASKATTLPLPQTPAVDTLVWGIGVGIEDEEWTSRDSTASIWQKHHPEPWRLSLVLDSLVNLRCLTVLVPDSFGEDVGFHESMAEEVSGWPISVRKLNFEYQRKRPTNRVREPVHLRGIEDAMKDTFRALVKRFSPVLEDLYWSGRVSLAMLQEEGVKNAQWPKLRKIRVDFGNYDLEGNWFFDLQRRYPVPWDPERSEGEEGWFEAGEEDDGWETERDEMEDDVEHNAADVGFAQAQAAVAPATAPAPIPLPSYSPEEMPVDDSYDDDVEAQYSSIVEDVMLAVAEPDFGTATFDDIISPPYPLPTTITTPFSPSPSPDPENEYTSRYHYNRCIPRRSLLDELHVAIFRWISHMPKLKHMLVICDSEKSEGNVQVRVVDRGKLLVFYSTEGNAYYPDEVVLEEGLGGEWEVQVEECRDAWGTCEVNLRFWGGMLGVEEE